MNSNVKFSVPLEDGYSVEAVYYGSGTLCLSSQVGCAMACPFCLSGSKGLVRNLRLDELDLQVALAARKGYRFKRLTLSGIGEPLQNFETVRRFIEEKKKGTMPVSVTTTGRPLANLEKLLHAPHNGLMLSVHAGTGATHRRLVPRGADLDQLWHTVAAAWQVLPRSRQRKIGINYLLLAGVNDTDRELEALAGRLIRFRGMTVHLLALNESRPCGLAPADTDAVARAHRLLRSRGINVRRANRWRRQPDGGCGTLAVSEWQNAASRSAPGCAIIYADA